MLVDSTSSTTVSAAIEDNKDVVNLCHDLLSIVNLCEEDLLFLATGRQGDYEYDSEGKLVLPDFRVDSKYYSSIHKITGLYEEDYAQSFLVDFQIQCKKLIDSNNSIMYLDEYILEENDTSMDGKYSGLDVDSVSDYEALPTERPDFWKPFEKPVETTVDGGGDVETVKIFTDEELEDILGKLNLMSEEELYHYGMTPELLQSILGMNVGQQKDMLLLLNDWESLLYDREDIADGVELGVPEIEAEIVEETISGVYEMETTVDPSTLISDSRVYSRNGRDYIYKKDFRPANKKYAVVLYRGMNRMIPATLLNGILPNEDGTKYTLLPVKVGGVSDIVVTKVGDSSFRYDCKFRVVQNDKDVIVALLFKEGILAGFDIIGDPLVGE